jgi:hypothetical protein
MQIVCSVYTANSALEIDMPYHVRRSQPSYMVFDSLLFVGATDPFNFVRSPI